MVIQEEEEEKVGGKSNGESRSNRGRRMSRRKGGVIGLGPVSADKPRVK